MKIRTMATTTVTRDADNAETTQAFLASACPEHSTTRYDAVFKGLGGVAEESASGRRLAHDYSDNSLTPNRSIRVHLLHPLGRRLYRRLRCSRCLAKTEIQEGSQNI
jgi:hypothetical protein